MKLSWADPGRRRITAVPLSMALLAGLLVPSVRAAENQAPVAVDDPAGLCPAVNGSIAVPEDYLEDVDGGEWFVLNGVCDLLLNDTDADGDPLTVEILDGPSNGDLIVDPLFTAYQPDPDFSTPEGTWVSDSFTYRAFDGQAYSEPATVRLWVAPVNDPPTLTPGHDVTVAEDAGQVSLQWATDVDPGPNESAQNVSFTLQPSSGVAHDCPAGPLMQDLPTIDGAGVLTIRAFPDCYGTYHVTFKVQDDGGTTPDYSEGSLTPNPDDTAPDVEFDIEVTPDGVEAHEDSGLTVLKDAGPKPVDVLANDIEAAGATLSIVGVTQGAHGAVAITTGGTGLTYDPAQGYTGPDLFTYTVSDGLGGIDLASVSLTVTNDTTKPTVTAPATSFALRAATASSSVARISWSGSDTETGVAKFDLQVSVDGGTFKAVPLGSPTATSVTRSQTHGRTYRYRVRATDRAGNAGDWTVGPAVTPRRVDSTSATIVYSGAWTTKRNANTIGGSHRYSTSKQAKATLTRTARDIAIVATKTPAGGSAQVWIDGVLAGTVDLRSETRQYRRVVFSRHFATPGTHTIELRPAGGGYVHVDAFLVMR